jgi:hypothetical protein
MDMTLTTEAYEAFLKGVENGTIKDTEYDVCQIALDQEIVSYSSSAGTYSFDYFDVVIGG